MPPSPAAPEALPRSVGLPHATALNMLHMVGIGPFITMPLLLATMGGPQAMVGWVLGAIVALADGLVWAELGAALPGSGGPYLYLREAFGSRTFGRLLAFVFIWQIVLTAPLSLAAGCVGFADYAARVVPLTLGERPWIAAAAAGLCVVLLYRNIRKTRLVSYALWGGLMAVVVILIAVGLPHAHWANLRFTAWPHGRDGFLRLGAATRYAMYDYAGYWTVNYFAAEVRDPARTIPRCILWSVGGVAALYLVMNTIIVAVLPLNVALHSTAVVTDLMLQVAGPRAALAMTLLILALTLASLYSALLGYSRVPYAAAADNNFFPLFRHLHPREQFPDYSLLLIGLLAAVACLFSLSHLIEYLLVLQILMKFLPQIAAQVALRRRPGFPLPFKMWLYPLPLLVALAGWTYIAVTANKGAVGVGLLLAAAGVSAFLLRARHRREWPFATADR